VQPLDPTDPERIGRYRLTHRLGAGGMGRVYLGRTAAGRKVVVKVILPQYAGDAEFRGRFAREAAAAARVGGFHTAPVVDGFSHRASAAMLASAQITLASTTQLMDVRTGDWALELVSRFGLPETGWPERWVISGLSAGGNRRASAG
jgi:serine/threonine protein kinase